MHLNTKKFNPFRWAVTLVLANHYELAVVAVNAKYQKKLLKRPFLMRRLNSSRNRLQ